MKLIAPSEACASTEPQQVGNYGVFPMPLTDTGKTEKEWQALIEEGVPVKIVTQSAKAAGKDTD